MPTTPPRQNTIVRPGEIQGVGLHTGAEVRMRIYPAAVDTGIVFRRTDLPGSPDIPANLAHVVGTDLGTSIGLGEAQRGVTPCGVEASGDVAQEALVAPRDRYDEALQEGYRYHSGRARVWQGLRVDERAPRGAHVVSGRVRYAACNDSICLPPREVPFSARLVVE